MKHNIFKSLPRRTLVALLLSAGVFSAATASATLPAPTGFAFAKGAKFTVAGYTGSSPLSGFPVLVRIAANSPSGFAYGDLHNANAVDPDDIDLAFIDMNGNGLPFEIDTWNTSDESLIWVRLPTMENGTQFVMCWGADSSGRAVCPDKPWGDYTGVWHMNDAGDGGATVMDSTTNNLVGTAVSTSKAKTDGQLGGARLITTYQTNNSGTPYDSGVTVDLSDPTKLAVVDAIIPEFSASMWIRPQNTTKRSNYNFLLTRKASDKQPGWGVQFDADTTDFSPLRFYTAKETDSNNDGPGDPANKKVVTSASTGIIWQEWHKLDVAWTQAGTYAIYVDGALISSGNLVNNVPATNGVDKLSIGGAMAAPPLNENLSSSHKNGRGFYGDMDEVRLRPGPVSADWIAADYATQTSASFLTAGTAKSYGPSSFPEAEVQVSPVGYTNATVVVSVSDFGTGGSSADVVVKLSATSDLATPFWTESYRATAIGQRSFDVSGLSTNATYFVGGALENNQGASTVLTPVSFTTLVPGAPEGTVSLHDRDTSSISVSATVTSFGAGSASASVRLELSTDAFATTQSSAWENVLEGNPAVLAFSSLSPLTAYDVRLRIRNEWGIETVQVLGRVATLPPSGVEELYVDSLGNGSGTSPESALPTIREAVDIAGPGFTIWVRGGEGRAYGVTNNADTIPIPETLGGLSIRAYTHTPGDGGHALVTISDTYINDGNRAHIVSNRAANVTVSGLDFSFGTTSVGKQNVGSCSVFWTAAPFTTMENCLLRMPQPTTYAGSGASSPLVLCASKDATNLVVRGCEFRNTRCWSSNHGYPPIKVQSNALIDCNVFSNVNSTVTGQQADLVYGPDTSCYNLTFVSNMVYGANEGGNLSYALLFGLFPGPKSAEIAFNRFVADPGARTQKGETITHRVNFSFAAQFAEAFSGKEATLVHHNTIIGGQSAFLFNEAQGNKRKNQFFSNLILLDSGGTNLVENVKSGTTEFSGGRTTSFIAPSFLRNNAYTGVLTGGNATALATYDLSAGMEIADNIALAAPPDFICTNDIYSEDFYRYRSEHGEDDLGSLGWAGENNEYPTYIGALPPLYPEETLIILR